MFIVAAVAVAVLIVAVFMIKSGKSGSQQKEARMLLEQVNAAQAQLSNVISRRNSLIPQLIASVQSLPELKKEIAQLEQKTSGTMADDDVSGQLSVSSDLKRLISLIPSANITENIQLLLIQIEGSENRISVEKKRYNDAVKQFNMLVNSNPESLSEFKPLPYLN